MIVSPGDTLTLHFRLAALDGSELDNTFGSEPVIVHLGNGELHANLEQCLIGLEIGKRYEFTLEPQLAFGHSDPALLRPIARSAFAGEIPTIGSLLEFTQTDGAALAGVIREIGDEQVAVDFNHPLSDCVVSFEVEVLVIDR